MKKIPSNVNTILDEFVNGVNEILGNRMKKIILLYHRRIKLSLTLCQKTRLLSLKYIKRNPKYFFHLSFKQSF